MIATFLGWVSYVKMGMGLGGILDDDIACTAHNPKTFPLDHTAGALAYQTFVRLDGDAQHSGVVTVNCPLSIYPCRITGCGYDLLANRSRRSIWLIICTPVILVNRKLTSRPSTPWSASIFRCSAFSAGEVESGVG